MEDVVNGLKLEKREECPTNTIGKNTDSGGIGVRHVFVAMSFSALSVFYMNRNNINLAIVAMVGRNFSEISKNNSDSCPVPSTANNTQDNSVEGEFDWDEEMQGLILGSFFYGYLVGNILGGIAADAFGGRWIIGVCGFTTSVLSVLSPLSARISVGLFIAVRVLSGLAQGPLYPGIFSLMSSWIPTEEKARIASIILVGSHFGTVISNALGGVLASSTFMGGWPSIFYIFGITGIVWSIIWIILVRNQPQEHPCISKREKQYIYDNNLKTISNKSLKIPWKDIWTSIPFLCLMVFALGDGLGFFVLLSETPTYLSNIQHFDLTSNGVLSALPYICIIIIGPIYGYIADKILEKKLLSLNQTRKISTAIGMYGSGISMVGMCFVNCNPTVAVVLLCLAVGINSGKFSGGLVSEQDIAPNYAGVLKGIINACAAITGVIAPMITGAITKDNETLSAWHDIYGMAAVAYFLGGTSYIAFGSVEVQKWNEIKNDEEKERY